MNDNHNKKREKIRTIILLVLFAAFIVAVALSYKKLAAIIFPPDTAGTEQSESAADADRTPAPDFTAQDKDGNSVSLSDFAGQPVVLNFWASWCSPCRGEMPDFDDVYGEAGEDVVFMMVNLTDGQRETVASASEFIAGEGFSFPVYFDTELSGATAYGVSGIPTTVFIDKGGYIVKMAQGAISAETLKAGIELIK